MWTRGQLKANGKQLFKNNYWACVGVTVLMSLFGAAGNMGRGVNFNINIEDYRIENFSFSSSFYSLATTVFIVMALLISILIIVLKIFVGNLLEVGGMNFFIKNRTEKAGIGELLSGFKSGHYGNIVLTLFLRDLYIVLWSLLFIIPGIIKGLEYRMVPYILAENPGMDRKEAFAISKRMMDGQKWDTFVLSLSFIGWELLSVITCGIVGIFYVNPYIQATFVELYSYNKIKAYNEGYIR